MSDFKKISYYDLRHEHSHNRLPILLGRSDELLRMNRILARQFNSNILIVGESGIGKTTLLRGWAIETISQNLFPKTLIIELDSEDLANISTNTFSKYLDAFTTTPQSILLLDNFGAVIYNKPQILPSILRVLRSSIETANNHLVLSMTPSELIWLQKEEPSFTDQFEILNIKPQVQEEQIQILQNITTKLEQTAHISIPSSLLEKPLEYIARFPNLGTLPKSAIRILDEATSLAALTKSSEMREEHILTVIADKTGVPIGQLATHETERLKTLEHNLNTRVLGQEYALSKIANIIKRARLGLKNPNRPLGSFLVLGPSGVGKTETAKAVAEFLYGRKESFIRLDMSEFGEAHTVQRLIGAPPGYIGFDAGGGLTNPVKQEPYSLILLDEIEKAHSKIFDIFLQLLDDGRLTSGQGETINYTQTIIMATSNLGVDAIIEGFLAGKDIHSIEFYEQYILPVLSSHFRMEFLNRFDAILVFKPLDESDLLSIAELEIQKIQERVKQHGLLFAIDTSVLANNIKEFANPRFGARPVKRYIEEVCETLITNKLLG